MYVSCPHCGKQYEVKEELAGRKARCSNPACKKSFVLPLLSPPGQPPTPSASGAAVAPLGTPAGPAPGRVGAGASPAAGGLDALLAAELGAAAAPSVGGPAMPAPGAGPQPAMDALGPAEAPLGLPPYLYRRRRRQWVRPALIGAGASAAVAVLVLVVIVVARAFQRGSAVSQATGDSTMADNGLPTWAAFCVPPEAKAVGYVNIDKVRQSAAMETLERLAKQARKSVNLRAQLTPLKELFFVGGPQASVAVLRTRDDLSLETIPVTLTAAESPQGSGATPPLSTHAGVSYVKFRDGYIAKLASCTYCASDRESELKQALERHQRGEAPPLSAELREALKNIPPGDHFLAMVPKGLQGGPLPPQMLGTAAQETDFRWLAAAGSIDSSIRGTVAVEFKASDQPAKLKADFDKSQKELAARADSVPPQMRQTVQKLLELLQGVQANQSGTRLTVTFQWSVKTMEELGQLVGR